MAPRMGPAEQLVRGAAEQSECWGFKVLQFVFGDVLPRGMRSAVRLRPSNLLSVSGSAFERLTLCLIRAWSRQASAPNLPASVGPRAKPGTRRLPKLSLCTSPEKTDTEFQCFLVFDYGIRGTLSCCSAGWRVKDQSKFLSRGAASAHFPDVD